MVVLGGFLMDFGLQSYFNPTEEYRFTKTLLYILRFYLFCYFATQVSCATLTASKDSENSTDWPQTHTHTHIHMNTHPLSHAHYTICSLSPLVNLDE